LLSDESICKRRSFLRKSFVSIFAFNLLLTEKAFAAADSASSFNGDEVFGRVVSKAKVEKWRELPIGELMGKIARELEGTPYVAGTLDRNSDMETCTIDLTGLDCVTFFETTLCFARMLKKGEKRPSDLLKEVRFTRYRDGKQGDYSSRLHYTSDWLMDNQKKGVVKLLSDLPGAEPFVPKVGFMSEHPQSYKALAAHYELIAKIKKCENSINHYELKYYPLDKLALAEPLLQTGDIVGVCTNAPGLDISHTGLVLRDGEGVAHFMDASSNKQRMKVTIEAGPISKTLNWSKSITGAVFARPNDV
jgi:cell wall-associated NlpC family hydrolase